MRTPGADRELCAGFLLSERIISDADDLGVIRHCVDSAGARAPNVVDVVLTGTAADRLGGLLGGRRSVVAGSACRAYPTCLAPLQRGTMAAIWP